MTDTLLTTAQLNNCTSREILGLLLERVELHIIHQFDGEDFVERYIPHAGGVALLSGKPPFADPYYATVHGTEQRERLRQIFQQKVSLEPVG